MRHRDLGFAMGEWRLWRVSRFSRNETTVSVCRATGATVMRSTPSSSAIPCFGDAFAVCGLGHDLGYA